MNQRLSSDQDVANVIDQVALAGAFEKVAFFGLTMPSVRAAAASLRAAGVNTLTLGFDHGNATHEDVIRQFVSDPEVTAIVIAAPACYGVSLPDAFADVVRFDLPSVVRAKVPELVLA